jgi:ubiquinone/menaquinone biosynthesis C-methylase UbiE
VVARELRRRLFAGLHGRVIEIGCGEGRAFELYPARVESVLAVEPDPTARAAAAEAARSAPVPVQVVDGLADRLPAADATFDAAVLVWVLCSVPDPAAALAEVARVLAPGGELRVYEHVRATGPALRLVQRGFDAAYWTRALGGCRTTRDTEAAIRAAGFEFAALDRGFHSSSLLTITAAPHIIGIAHSAASEPGPGPE